MKNQRILDIYLRLLNNKEVNRKKLAQEYEVSERSLSLIHISEPTRPY